ncbi:S-layer homology domain-containing protein [Fusibacter sp. 3D3]|uniref:S-layer homology domain-containing protein n=1 Tax=Fusibacter sp. 3D3 TaxID=1048380 RepID=UPI0008538667|nr:S-layer homology domain-containing protein [Fusibacter sp. 3D3]GAU77017.1 hypothetical protein F3D3_1616 [Fusibacter sp. 3D3]
MTRKKWRNKVVSLSTTLILLVTMIPVLSFAGPSDIQKHWAQTTLEEWTTSGFASGYPDGTFRPDEMITRAEFMTLVNKVFYFTQENSINFSDVSVSDWYYSSVKKAVAAGYIKGYPDNTMGPNRSITRQEAAIIIAKVKGLELTSLNINNFSDASSIANWSRSYVGAVVNAGLMSGYPDGTFRPTDIIKRAEALVALNNAMSASYTAYDASGIYGPATGIENVANTVIIKSDGVTLQNMHITGDLIISEAVGTGSVTLNNVTVDGATYVRGGGVNSIYINGGKYNKVIVQKTSSGNVRIVAKNINDLEVVISESAAGQTVVLEGTFKKVQINAPNVTVKTQGETTIDEMTISSTAIGAKVDLGVNTVVKMMKINTKIHITGKGKIIKAEVSVDGVTFETQPTDGVVRVDFNTPVTPSTPSSGGGSSGGSGGNDGDDTVNVSGVSVLPTTMGLVVGGSTGTVTATVSPTNATNKSLTWTSSNLSVATVVNGVVTPVAVGTTNVVATSVANTSMSAICVVTVTEQAAIPTAVTLAVGSLNPVGGVNNVVIPAANGTDTTGFIAGWAAGTADKIKFTVTNGGLATSSITINGTPYTSGADYTVLSTSSASIVVTTSETGKTTVVRTFIVSVTSAPAVLATAPSAVTLAKGGSEDSVGNITNVSIPAEGATDNTGAIVDWVAATADKIKFTVTNVGLATSNITINGTPYTSGADYKVLSTSNVTVVVTTTETGKITATRTFIISVSPAALATSPSAITLAVGSANPVGAVTDVAIPVAGGTDNTGAVTDWSYMNADRIKFTVTNAPSTSSTIQINGSDYTSGVDHVIATSTSALTVVVTTTETGKTPAIRTFNISVTENPVQATTPSAITLAVGSMNPVGGVTNVAIPAAGGTDTTGAITGWVTGTNDKIKFTVTASGSGSETTNIQINGVNYYSGVDYTVASISNLSIVTVTRENGKATVVRNFTITVSP